METDRDDKESALFWVKRDGSYLEVFSERLRDDREVVLEALTKHCAAISHASERLRNDGEFILEAARRIREADVREEADIDRYYSGSDLQHTFTPNLSWALLVTNARLWDDRRFVLEAVKIDRCALEYASARLKGDEEVVFAATKSVEGQ